MPSPGLCTSDIKKNKTGSVIRNYILKDLAGWTLVHLGLYQETVQSQGRLLKQRLRKVT